MAGREGCSMCTPLHAMLVPGPGLGHFNAALLLAKALIQAGFSVVTVACFATPYAANAPKIESQMKSVASASIRLEIVSDGIDPSQTQGYGSLFAYTAQMKEALSCLVRRFASDEVRLPAIACLISDAFMAWTQDVADSLGIPRIEHFTASATSYIILLAAKSFISKGHVPFAKPPTKWRSDPPVYIDWVPGLPGFPLDDLPQNFTHLTDVNTDPFLKKCYEAGAQVKKADRVLIHSAFELESDAFNALAAVYGIQAYATGPLVQYNSLDMSHANGKAQYMNGASDCNKVNGTCNGDLKANGNGNHSSHGLKMGNGTVNGYGNHSSHGLSSGNGKISRNGTKERCSNDNSKQDDSFTGHSKQERNLNPGSNGHSKEQDYTTHSVNGERNGKLEEGGSKQIASSDSSNAKCVEDILRQQQKDVDCLKWLDEQEDESVIYISFGSNVTLSAAEVQELALGIEASGQSFLWVLRTDQCESGQALSAGFSDRAKGLIVPWAPQVAVLKHPAVGGFLSHCGWNSVLESLWEGMPMLGCPRAAEQRLNMRFVARDWGVGVEMERTEEGGLDRKFVEEGVKLLMVGDLGRQVRQKARLLGRHFVRTYSSVPPALLDLARDMRSRLHAQNAA